MKKTYYTLEVVCHKDNCKDTRLAFNQNNYFCAPLSRKVFVSNEGPSARYDKQSVNLFSLKNISELKLPQDIDSYSLVLFKKTNYISNNSTITMIDSEKEIVKVGSNLFIYDAKCDIVNLTGKNEYNLLLNKYASMIRLYMLKQEKKKIKEISEIELESISVLNNNEYFEKEKSLKLV